MPTAQPAPARRTAQRPPAPDDYPESDGKPMAETPIHWRATVDVAHPLMQRYADRPDAYVGSDMLMYWEEGELGKRASPDVFVAFGPGREPERRVWLVWAEGKAADFVLEVTSRSTRRRDEGFKAALYQRLEVGEYWQFDPTRDYLRPGLKGRRLGPDGAYEPISLEERDGGLSGWSAALGLELRPQGHALRLFDPALGEFLPTHREQARIIGDQADAIKAMRMEREAANAERDAEAAARRAAEARIAELERRLAGAGE